MLNHIVNNYKCNLELIVKLLVCAVSVKVVFILHLVPNAKTHYAREQLWRNYSKIL